jgi:protein-disulfide isomerase
MSKKRQPIAPPPKNYLPFVLIAVVLLAAVGAGVWYWRAAREPARAGTLARGASGAQPPRARGPASAPLVLEEFGDYQCPPCGLFYPEIEKIKRDYGDKLRLVFRHYPLTQAHPNALAAAHAAEAAGLQDKFWELHDQLYRNQREWAKAADPHPLFEDYAHTVGLDVERFAHDMNSAEVDARIVADHERATSLGVKATPTFFLNGHELSADKIKTPDDLRAALDAALSGKSF